MARSYIVSTQAVILNTDFVSTIFGLVYMDFIMHVDNIRSIYKILNYNTFHLETSASLYTTINATFYKQMIGI